jgi:ribonuclease HII
MSLTKSGVPVRRASPVSGHAYPDLRLERKAWQRGYVAVAGVDEVGRGAWAGPLVAAALLLPRDPSVRSRLTRALNRAGLSPRDSKLMNHGQRRRVVEVIDRVGLRYAVAEIEVPIVDSIGAARANHLALCKAVQCLEEVDYALVDHFAVDALHCDSEAVPKGDRACLSIALASIVAKVHRDEHMRALDEVYPGYGFSGHKGYGTSQHADALDTLGVTDEHRRSFKPVADRLARA